MHYKMINNRLFKINDDGSMIEQVNFDSKQNIITEIRKNLEPVDVIAIKNKKQHAIIAPIAPTETVIEKKKRGRPKKQV